MRSALVVESHGRNAAIGVTDGVAALHSQVPENFFFFGYLGAREVLYLKEISTPSLYSSFSVERCGFDANFPRLMLVCLQKSKEKRMWLPCVDVEEAAGALTMSSSFSAFSNAR